jgi:hypothetical protein
MIYLTRTYLALEENGVPCEQKWRMGAEKWWRWRDDEDEENVEIFSLFILFDI